MTRWPFHLLFAICFLLAPIGAQDGDNDSGIEIGDGCGGEEIDMTEEEIEETRRRNAGLGGQPESGDDPNAPKVKIPLQKQINTAIENGVEWLEKAQGKDGSWGPVRANSVYGKPDVRGDFVRDELGPTAWAVYTLAKCGEKRSSPAIRKGLKFLAEETKYVFDVMGGKPERDPASHGHVNVSRRAPRALTTYESAALVLMIEAVYEGSAKLTGKHRTRRLQSDNPLQRPARSRIPKKTWKFMHDRIIHLTVGRRGGGRKSRTIAGTQNITGKNAGGWRYGQRNGDADLSATQFVLLALRAASQAGYPVEKTSRDVWESAAQYVKNCQRSDGGFSYQIGSPKTTGSMTACGVACLVICKEQLELIDKRPPSWIDDSIKRGMEWLDSNFRAGGNPGGRHHYYYLYGIERVGDLTGRKEFAAKDWYVRGAQFLLRHQNEDGKWVDSTAFKPHDVIGTCFALLFLKRATPPTVTPSR